MTTDTTAPKLFGGLSPVVADLDRWCVATTLAERAQTHHGKVFLTAPEEDFVATFDETYATVTTIARNLLAGGAVPGDRVLIFADNSVAFLQTTLACAYAGLVQVPVHSALAGDLLEHQVRVARPAVAVADERLLTVLNRSDAVHAHVGRIYVITSPVAATATEPVVLHRLGQRTTPFIDLLRPAAGGLPTVRSRDLAAVLFTSGTTGASKGVMLSYRQMHWLGEEQIAKVRLSEDDVYLNYLPLFHAAAQNCIVSPSVIAGSEMVLRSKFSGSRWLDMVRTGNVTVTNMLGAMMEHVYRQPASAVDADNRVRCIQSNPTPWDIVDDFRCRFGVEHVTESIGQTEIGTPICTPYGATRPVGAAGLLIDDWYEVRIVDEDDHEVPPGVAGEYVVRPRVPWITTLGYFGMPEATAEATRNLWFHTGDRLRRDADGWYYFAGRESDSIRRRGENISAQEVEAAIHRHPAVAAVAVVPVRHEVDDGEEEVLAVIVPEPDAPPGPADIWDWCDEHLPYYARPRYVRFVDELPLTSTGKVQKGQLRSVGLTPDTVDRVKSEQAVSHG
jgi:crotonobetaine/carnitine-CoA ligase